MEHGAHFVDILDQYGHIAGQKRRRDIDKTKDIYHAVYIVLVTPEGEVVLTHIPERDDLPNLYAGQLGVPVATIRRHDESTIQAARRAAARELFIDDAEVHELGQEMFTLADGRKTLVSVFYLVGEPPETFSKTDLAGFEVMTPAQVSRELQEHPEKFAPTLRLLWQRYVKSLPV